MDISKTVNYLQNQPSDTLSSLSKIGENGETSPDAPQSTGEDFSTFLTLLTAQIKNQDPLAPLDSTQFVEQLATFTNLELQAKGNQSLELIAGLLARQIELLEPSEAPVTDA